MSKLDRFMVSHNFFEKWKETSINVLGRCISDHCPLVFVAKTNETDFGPKCFKVFDQWLEEEEFGKIVKDTWNSDEFRGTTDIVLKNKIKALKIKLRQ